jgi:hypothetical protein
MKPTGFYKLSHEYIGLIKRLGGKYRDSKERPAIFKVSNVLPVTETYIDGEYTSQGMHLVLRDKTQITEIERKLSRILFDEGRHPNKYEQHITSVYSYLNDELMSKPEI